MIHHHFYHQDTGTWTHLFACDENKVCVVIDSVLDYEATSETISTRSVDEVINYINDKQWQLKYILETHAHADHLSAAQVLKKQLGGEVCIGLGIIQVQEIFKDRLPLGEHFKADGRDFDLLLSEGDQLIFGQELIKVMSTPGHTSDGLTYLIDDYAVIGDTLFYSDSGTARCDFPGGSAALLYQSILNILSLPDETKLCLAHDYPEERKAESMITVAAQKSDNIHCKTPFDQSQYIKIRTQRDKQLAPPKLLKPSLIHNIRAGLFF